MHGHLDVSQKVNNQSKVSTLLGGIHKLKLTDIMVANARFRNMLDHGFFNYGSNLSSIR